MALNLIYVEASRAIATAFATALVEQWPCIDINHIALDASGQSPASLIASPSILLFGDETGDTAILSWCQQRPPELAHMPLVPVSVLAGRDVPPQPLTELKSRQWPSDREIILNRIGALLGLRLRPGEQKVFISFRTSDGLAAATILHKHLADLGYRPWLDEAQDPVSGEPNMPLADDVGMTIENNLRDASAIILLDTPDAPGSRWIHREVTLAVGMLVPILPIVLYPEGTTFAGCRFRELQGLHRLVPCITAPNTVPIPNEAHLDAIVAALEDYLHAVYHRRVIQAAALRAEFMRYKWTCGDIPGKHHLHKAERTPLRQLLPSRLLSCCSFEDRIFAPAVRQYVLDIQELLSGNSHFNHHLYFYPGELEYNENLAHLFAEEVPSASQMNLLFVNYQEVPVRIAHFSQVAV